MKELVEGRSVEEWLSAIEVPLKNIPTWFKDVKIGNTTFKAFRYGGNETMGRSLAVNINHVTIYTKKFWFFKWNKLVEEFRDSVTLYDKELEKIDTTNIDEAIRIALERKQQRQDAIIYGDFND